MEINYAGITTIIVFLFCQRANNRYSLTMHTANLQSNFFTKLAAGRMKLVNFDGASLVSNCELIANYEFTSMVGPLERDSMAI